MKRYKGFMTQEFAANSGPHPMSVLASIIVASCRDDDLEPVGTLTAELRHIDRDFIENRPKTCVWTFYQGEL